jgi:hypothetical protein
MSAPALAPPAVPDNRRERVTELARTTPGELTILAVALVLVSVLVGVLSAVVVQARSTALDDLTTSSGPLSVAAQDIYRSLSDADATATSAFLAGGEEPADQRARYENDIAQAESALAVAVAARAPGDVTHGPLATLSAQLSVYTGLVETARADNHQGLPVGAAYQGEASNLMRTKLLTAAQGLYRAETEQVSADEDDAGGFPFVELLLGIVALATLVTAQVYVRRRSNRVFNVGLMVATGAALVSLVWTMIAALGVGAAVDDGRTVFTGVDRLAEARIDTLTARADETLTLVARGSGAAYEKDFKAAQKRLAGFVDGSGWSGYGLDAITHIKSAQSAEESWSGIHKDIRKADDGGDYTRAVQLAIGSADDGAAAKFDAVDRGLANALKVTNQHFTDKVSQASGAITGTVLGVILLAALMAAGSVAGVWQRLKEYR